MATKTFSSRADADLLAYADAIARKEYGLSYGQYCGTVLLEAIGSTGRMPQIANNKTMDEKKSRAVSFIKEFASLSSNPEIGKMSDRDIRNLIANKYV
ncbi:MULTISPECIES: hypothetical protein [unclassified Adlercreutzia]|uniref:hypothetical protein n=1 Tax=unclassified Adlercreutzia TaxID=2636013 RepID=UPI0013E9B210|nr:MULTISPECIES: hypothetical protein [unclassified Adlercreutzia]